MARDERRPLPKKTARTRMLLKAPLGWLAGFPMAVSPTWSGDAVEWWSPSSVAEQDDELRERQLRRASRALLEIRTELLDTLPLVVPDPDRWLACAEEKLSAAGRMVHHGEDPSALRPPRPRELAGLDDVSREHPRLAPLVEAVAWCLWTAPWHGKDYVKWICRQADALAALFDVEFQVEFEKQTECDTLIPVMELLTRSAVDGVRGSGALLQALAHPDLDIETRGEDAKRHVEALLPSKKSVEALKARRIEVPGRTDARQKLLDFVLTWTLWDRPTRRATARAWALAFDGAVFELWSRWWREIGVIRDKLENFEELELTLKDPVRMLSALEKSLRRRLEGDLWRRRPASFVVRQKLDAVVELAAHTGLLRAVERALDVLPAVYEHMPIRAILLEHWGDLAEEYAADRLTAHVDSFRRLVASAGRSVLGPWEDTFRFGYDDDVKFWTPDEYVLGWTDPPPLDSVEMTRICLGAGDHPVEQRDLIFCLGLADAAPEAATTAVAWAFDQGCDLRSVDMDLWEPLRLAVSVAPDPESLGRIVLRLSRLKDSEPADLLMAGARCLAGPLSHRPEGRHRAWAAVEMIDRDPSALTDLARRLRLADALAPSDDETPEWLGSTDRSWVDEYPAQLRADLHALADCDLEGERTARKVLRREVRDVGSLERELAALDEKLQSALTGKDAEAVEEPQLRELRVRRDKLDSWLREPQPIPERKLRRVRLKLRRAAGAAQLADLKARLDERLVEALGDLARRHLGESLGSVDLLLKPDAVLLVEAVVALDDKAARRFGLELLLRRCGPRPWDLREHPDNQKFLRRMGDLGIDTAEWVDGAFRRTFRADDGRELTLTLERDPLQVLRMGAPFGTCLSPWDFNFYSAVVNAVDLDKQVVFARDAEGRIMGRCLIAVGRTGGGKGDHALIAFFPYSHDTELGFARMMAEYAADLARTMGLPLVPRGHVTALVCPNWYDDGPRDLRGDLEFLQDGSTFREELADMEPSRLASALPEEAPHGVDAHILAALLPYLEDKPELVVGIAPWIDRLRLPAVDRLRAASLARSAGRDDLARRWVEQLAGHLRGPMAFPWWNRPLGETLAELAPSLTLRLLRETRRKGVRSWAGETCVHRMWIAGQAHLALHRKTQALGLLRRIAAYDQVYNRPPVVDKARRALNALERRLAT